MPLIGGQHSVRPAAPSTALWRRRMHSLASKNHIVRPEVVLPQKQQLGKRVSNLLVLAGGGNANQRARRQVQRIEQLRKPLRRDTSDHHQITLGQRVEGRARRSPTSPLVGLVGGGSTRSESSPAGAIRERANSGSLETMAIVELTCSRQDSRGFAKSPYPSPYSVDFIPVLECTKLAKTSQINISL